MFITQSHLNDWTAEPIRYINIDDSLELLIGFLARKNSRIPWDKKIVVQFASLYLHRHRVLEYCKASTPLPLAPHPVQ